MKCINCGHDGLNVIDSRNKNDGSKVRRRRVCPKCNHRVTTIESIIKCDVTPEQPIAINGEIMKTLIEKQKKAKEIDTDKLFRDLGLE